MSRLVDTGHKKKIPSIAEDFLFWGYYKERGNLFHAVVDNNFKSFFCFRGLFESFNDVIMAESVGDDIFNGELMRSEDFHNEFDVASVTAHGSYNAETAIGKRDEIHGYGFVVYCNYGNG